jgi:hypothetical protein
VLRYDTLRTRTRSCRVNTCDNSLSRCQNPDGELFASNAGFFGQSYFAEKCQSLSDFRNHLDVQTQILRQSTG